MADNNLKETLFFRADAELVRRIGEWVETRQSQLPCIPLSRSAVVRELVVRALDCPAANFDCPAEADQRAMKSAILMIENNRPHNSDVQKEALSLLTGRIRNDS